MKHDEPTPPPDRPVPPIFADDETLQSMMDDGALVMTVYAGLIAALGKQVVSKHDLTRTLVVAAALSDIGSVRNFETGFGSDGFAELASNAWLKVEEIRQRMGEKWAANKSQADTTGEKVDEHIAALIEKQLGSANLDKQ